MTCQVEHLDAGRVLGVPFDTMRRAKKKSGEVAGRPKTIPFRPNAKLRDRLEAEKEATGAPFQKIIEKALDAYLKRG